MKIKIFGIMALCLVFIATSCSDKKEAKTYTTDEISAESKKANELFDKLFDETVDRYPEYLSYLGNKKDYDKWSDHSDEMAKKELEIQKGYLEKLKKEINFDALDENTRISYRMFEEDVKQQEEGFKFRFHNYPIEQMAGYHSDIPTFMINIHTVSNVSDANAYIKRLETMDAMMAQRMQGMLTREEMGIIPPKFVFPMVQNDIKNILTGKPFDKSAQNSPLLDDITAKVNALDSADTATKKDLITRAEKALVEHIKPAYENLSNYLTELEKKATDEDGAWKFPDGAAYYNYALKKTTTTDLTSDQIHELGLKEVARIQTEMREIMKKVNFKSDSLQEFFHFIRTDPQFTFPNTDPGRQAALDKNIQIIDGITARLDELFITKPKAKLEVKRVEAYREKSAGGAFYQQPALDGSRPGTYYLNVYNTADQPIYQMEALAYHEAIPGHHMQISIAQELQGVPKFRKMGGFTAYVEGWGLYSELLPKEYGFYQDPYSDFGRLAMEIFRAARLVVDTGIHSKKWTRQQALDYMLQNTSNPVSDIEKEVTRYIVWPSQATGYKIGMLKILELREMAKAELGDKFDIREFHEVVLTQGPVPLSILEEMVKEMIAKKKANA